VIDGPNAGSDLFIHHSSIMIAIEQYKYLVQGEYVEFTLSSIASGDHKCQAADVTGIRRGLLMCETRQAALDYSQHSHQEQEEQQEEKEKPKQKKTAATDTATSATDAAWTPVSKRSPRHDKDQGRGGRGPQSGRGSQGRGTRGGRGTK
jgi:cold shock CspA family protein